MSHRLIDDNGRNSMRFDTINLHRRPSVFNGPEVTMPSPRHDLWDVNGLNKCPSC